MKIALRDLATQELRNHWGYAIAAFPDLQVTVVGGGELVRPLHTAAQVSHLSELTGPLVVMSPLDAHNLPGEINLYSRPPVDATYVFWGDHENLKEEDLAGCEYELVYLPCGQLYSAMAFVVTALYVSNG
jgi:hypothetical protein